MTIVGKAPPILTGRSFRLNDGNLNIYDAEFAAKQTQVFEGTSAALSASVCEPGKMTSEEKFKEELASLLESTAVRQDQQDSNIS
jgi:hypothetical protein